MLNPFPDLLVLSFFAPTILRLMLALVFLGGAYAQWRRTEELAQLRLPLIGGGAWVVRLSIAAHLAIGVMFLFGYYTQIAALGGLVAGLKGIVWATRYPRFFPLRRLEYVFILAISLSLLISGAGGFAFDLPL